MGFDVGADAYGRFMGRFAEPLAVRFADVAGVVPGLRALDVGCGTGALTAELAARLGPAAVSAVDPSAPFVAAARERLPQVDIRRASAELLPFPDGGFDVTLAQLVVHFMTDPVAGLREMARVTRPGGVVAACVWDHAGGRGPLTVFWQAVRSLDPDAHDESGLAGAREGHLAALFAAAGLRDVRSSMLTVEVSFDQWWEPYTLGVGPAGDHVQRLDAAGRATLRDRCASLLGERWPVEVSASAWTAIGRTP
ncbi:class I SAM-dependent methyltransferase [Micromonospora tulbaghiae]|uniref:Class I SAM-dependent methyltransferase n=1 Tax=Micromonospora tulbaghiae TaxID=479978 RepID=A0AAW4JAU4_9ACTN|nr:class I SAM-dependent methyltransferase [Micromonospora tulbaghiae]MBO4138963.1 class I SAM-dependent methyltransferase [Micromonospora tulbaghiae]